MNCKDLLERIGASFASVGECVIAGGAPRDEFLGRVPKDYDVFVLCGDRSDAKVQTVIEVAESLIPTTSDEDSSSPMLIRQGLIHGHNVQVMAVPFINYIELLDSFDWNICRFVFTRDGLINLASSNIAPNEYLTLQTVTRPLSSLRRGFRFCERYSMLIEQSALTRLCTEVLSQMIAGSGVEEELVDAIL